ncbi:unnamed protein product [Heterobilharzia americana]|nr:unnamed protein product [Heterobilharzia americana]
MPAKRRFASRFPTTRIKKIMQLDEEIGKLTATVPPIVSRSLELFLEQLLNQAYQFTSTRSSKTISPGIIKYVIEHEPSFSFLRPLVADVPELKPNSRKPSYSKGNCDSDAQSESSDGSSFSVDETSPRTLSSNAKKPTRQKRKQSPCSRTVHKRTPMVEKLHSMDQNHESSLNLMPTNKANKIRKNGSSVSSSETGTVPVDGSSVRNESLVDYQYTEA